MSKDKQKSFQQHKETTGLVQCTSYERKHIKHLIMMAKLKGKHWGRKRDKLYEKLSS